MTNRELLNLGDQELDKIVKIQGTQYDRRRKLTDKQIEKARILYAKYDATLWDLAVMFDVNVRTIRYNLQSSYRAERLEYAKAHPQTRRVKVDSVAAMIDRVAYKRQLIARRKVLV